MRLRSICVHVDFNPKSPLKLRARCYQYEGKTEIVWGRAICYEAKTPADAKRAIERAFRGRVRSVWVTWDDNLEMLNEMLEFAPVELPVQTVEPAYQVPEWDSREQDEKYRAENELGE